MKDLIEKIKRRRVVVVGDIMLDHYVWGDAGRISPEAPVPVVDVERDSYVPGGAANVALNIRSLGAEVVLCGSVSRDEAGERLMSILGEKGVVIEDCFKEGKAPTILKTRVIVRHQQLCRLDREGFPVEYGLKGEKCWGLLEEEVEKADAVIFSDYSKGVITEELIKRVTDVGRARGTLLAMDPKPQSRLNFSGLDLMTPNRAESLELSGVRGEPHQAFPAEAVCQALWERYQTKQLVITLGGEGMLLSEVGRVKKTLPTVAQEVFDVSGAGDTVIAALTTALSCGVELEEAAHFANVAAGIVVSKVGTATVKAEEILEHVGV